MKTRITFVAALAVLSIILFAQSEAVRMPIGGEMDFDKAHPAYVKGVNDALDAITLLSLEQRLEGTNRTWSAMANIVRERERPGSDAPGVVWSRWFGSGF